MVVVERRVQEHLELPPLVVPAHTGTSIVELVVGTVEEVRDIEENIALDMIVTWPVDARNSLCSGTADVDS